MILPFTHEDMFARRWPIVTIGIIVACVACFVLQLLGEGGRRDEVAARTARAVEYWQAHPYLALPPPVDRWVAQAHVEPADDALAPPADASQLEAEQAYLDDRAGDVRRAIADAPSHRWGFVPLDRNWVALLTSQFLHSGWLHLIFNMWFLWLCGCNLEDRWGRLVFGGFYLSAGAVAGLVHMASAPASAVPMLGASGAIAGAMGAFVVSFARTRIKFVYLYLLRPGVFTAPAFVMLPLWGAQELASGLLFGGGDGVAHWAHVGGFFYGVLFALVLRRTGVEARLDDAVEATVSTMQDERIMRAAELTTAGRARPTRSRCSRPSRRSALGDVDARLRDAARREGREATAGARPRRTRTSCGSTPGRTRSTRPYDLLLEAQGAGLDGAVAPPRCAPGWRTTTRPPAGRSGRAPCARRSSATARTTRRPRQRAGAQDD